MDLKDVGFEGVDWIDLAQDEDKWRSLVNTVKNIRGTGNAEIFLSDRSDCWLLRKFSAP
jgi:hypothetical protein